MPSSAIGAEEKAPKALTPFSGKRHLTFRLETFAELIAACVVARVFARSELCAGHEPASGADWGGACPTAEAPGDAAGPTAALMASAISTPITASVRPKRKLVR